MGAEEAVDPNDVRNYVETVQSALGTDPSMSARTAELRVTQPLLDVLGWDLHGGSVVAGYRADDAAVGFALCVDDDPRVFVDTATPSDGLSPADGDRLLTAMRSAGVGRGLLTDGHTVAFVSLLGDRRDHHRVNLDELPEHTGALAHYTPDALADDERTVAARALARDSEALTERLAEDLLDATDGQCEGEIRTAVDTFLGRLVRRLGGDGVDVHGADSATETGRREDQEDHPSASDGPAETTEGSDDPADDRSAERGGGSTEVVAADPTDATTTSDDEEFVARFFDGPTSVGAVGGSAPLSALLQTAELLERQRAVLRGVPTPWEPEGSGRVVLTDAPVGDGPTRQLPTGQYLATDLTEAEAKAAVEGLATAGGLRVMFQGDW